MDKSRTTTLAICTALLLFFIVDNLIGALFLYGTNARFGLNRHSEILLIGHSHLMLATDEDAMQKALGTTISKYTREGVNVADRHKMVEQYLNSPFSDSLKLVLYGVDLCTFTGGKSLADNSYTLFYPFLDDPTIAHYVKSQTYPANYYVRKLIKTYRFSDDGIKNASLRGLLHDNRNLKRGTIDIEAYKARLARGDERHIEMDSNLIALFDSTIRMCTDRGIRVALVNTPTLDLLNNFEADKYQAIVDWFTKYSERNALVEYWDFNPSHSSSYDLFYDRLHLNASGQKVITAELIEKIRSLNL